MTETLITALSWGDMEVTIDGEKQAFKDCKIWLLLTNISIDARRKQLIRELR